MHLCSIAIRLHRGTPRQFAPAAAHFSARRPPTVRSNPTLERAGSPRRTACDNERQATYDPGNRISRGRRVPASGGGELVRSWRSLIGDWYLFYRRPPTGGAREHLLLFFLFYSPLALTGGITTSHSSSLSAQLLRPPPGGAHMQPSGQPDSAKLRRERAISGSRRRECSGRAPSPHLAQPPLRA